MSSRQRNKQAAIDADAPTPAELRQWVVVGRGPRSTFAAPTGSGRTLGEVRRQVESGASIRLDADLAGTFRDSAAVNSALRSWLRVKEAIESTGGGRRRKTA